MIRNDAYDEGTFVEDLEERFARLQKRYFRRKDVEQFVRWAAQTAHNAGMTFTRMRELIVAAFETNTTEVLKGPIIWVGRDPACMDLCADMTLRVGTREVEVSINV